MKEYVLYQNGKLITISKENTIETIKSTKDNLLIFDKNTGELIYKYDNGIGETTNIALIQKMLWEEESLIT